MPLSGAHDTVLVALSILLATFASYTALDLAGRVRMPDGRQHWGWLATAAIVMGGGIWAMHFVAMLAFSLPVPMSFEPGLTLLSLLLPIVVTAFGFALVSRQEAGSFVLVLSGLVMGLGVAAMHYTGMAAMQIPADLRYDSLWIALSVLIAIGASVAALWFAFRTAGRWRRIAGSAMMGLAISGMHYTAMHAATFSAHAAVDDAQGRASLTQVNLALAVTLITCLILAVALLASSSERSRMRDRMGLIGKVHGQRRHTQSGLNVLIVASVIVPAGVFALAAWQNWRSLEANAQDRALKSVNLIAEHALKVFQNNEQVLNRADERLRGLPLDQIRPTYPINAYLNTLVAEVEHLEAIGLIGPDGRLLAVSKSFPAPPVDLSQGDYFTKATAFPVRSHVSALTRAVRDGRVVFRLSRQRTPEGERPSGVFYASMSPDYFSSFYRTITGGEDSVTMARADGTVLVRDPPVTTGVSTLSGDSGFMRSIARADRGLYRTVSELDAVGHLHAYQRVGLYPVYVSYGLSLGAVTREWHRNLLSFGAVAALAALALLSLSLFALRRANQERRIYTHWEQETERRESAEEALRQAHKMEAVGQLTGGIAHDFNNLLTVVAGNLEFAGKALEKQNIPKAHRNIEAALHGAQRAAALTHRLLAFSRRQPLQPQVVNLNRLVAGMSDLFRRTLGESIQVETVLAGGLWSTFADPNQLESALLNLVINARDAMAAGGRLTIETANSHLDDAYAAAEGEVKPGQYVMVAVTDTGTGMPPEIIDRVFEPFFTTKEIGQGTGLGLSMIYGFVKQSGGHVKIYSEPGEGTTVKIYLARTNRPDDPPTASPAQAPRSESGETILVVEDDPEVRAYSVETLTSLGYRVLEARDGAYALIVLEAHPEIDLLFTDVGLPGMNGRQLADEVKLRRPDLPILFTSGYTRNAIVHNGMLDPGVRLLNKPFTIEQLAAKVRDAIVVRNGVT